MNKRDHVDEEMRLEMQKLGFSDFEARSKYSFTHIIDDGEHLIYATQHWSYDVFKGEGKTIQEALLSMKIIGNCYRSDFRKQHPLYFK